MSLVTPGPETNADVFALSLADEQRDVAQRRIVRAARTALTERGLDTTVDDVAAAAGVSRRTIFRHFGTRDRLLAAAIRSGVAAYGERLALEPPGDDVHDWLLQLLTIDHRINATNGRVYWDLAALESELEGELAEANAERSAARRRFAQVVTAMLWKARDGGGDPPTWLHDTVAVHLSGFTTQALVGDFDRTPDEVARVSARVIEAALDAALRQR